LPSAFAAKKTTFAVHKRTFARAADVSPPWFCEPHLQVQCDEFRRLDLTTAGLRQPLLVARRSFAVKNDIRDAQTHAHKSGGRQPAVVDRSCIALRTLVGKNNFRDAQTHVRPRAAGVSPPWSVI
jgi:hypothetical protein